MSLVTTTWLRDGSARRAILVRIVASTGTLYLSNTAYTTTDSSVTFLPIISNGFSFTESMSLEGDLSVTYTDIELYNTDGAYDSYLTSAHKWINASIDVYYGDPTWACTNFAQITTDFECIFTGRVSDIDSSNINRLNFKIVDALQRLNYPLSETKIGTYGIWGSGNQTNADSVVPIVFGEVFNISPVLIDPSTLEYYVNLGNTESLIEVRDNGVPLSNTTFVSTTGKFKLGSSPVGTITASVQGVKQSVSFPSSVATPTLNATYANTIASILAVIATQYGGLTVSANLALTDIDPATFYAFSISSSNRPIGIFITDRTNVLELCNSIASSVGAQIYMNRLGKLQILQLGTYTPDTAVDIGPSNILANTFSISSRSKIKASTKIAYAKNWTVQNNLTTAIPSGHKDSFETEWLTVSQVDATVRTDYKLTNDPEQIETLLITSADASAEATRRLNLVKVTKTVYKFVGTSELLTLKLGQQVNLTMSRFSLNATPGQVVSLTPDWGKGKIEIEVMV